MVHELAVGDILLRQRHLAASERIGRKYDLVLAGLSWESRGTSALALLADPKTSVTLIKFKSRNAEVEADKIQQLDAFRLFLSNLTIKEIEPSTETQKNFRLLKAWIQDLYASAGRTLSILIDVTCIPKTYVLYLLGLGFSDELFARFDCLYTPGKYDLQSLADSPSSMTGPRSLLSEGEWSSSQIPYLEASDYIANDIDLFVTFGGELCLSLPFIERHEPRRLCLVFIKESAPNASTNMIQSEKLAYEQLRQEPNTKQVDIGLCDALEVAHLASSFASSSDANGVRALAIGSKPHALALGIAALGNRSMEVICRTPASYRRMDVPADGPVMLYEIEDRFDPRSYLIGSQ